MRLFKIISISIITFILLTGCTKCYEKIKNKPKQILIFNKDDLDYTLEIQDYIYVNQPIKLDEKYIIRAHLSIENKTDYAKIIKLHGNFRLLFNNVMPDTTRGKIDSKDYREGEFSVVNPGYKKEFRIEWIYNKDIKIKPGKDTLRVIIPKSYSIKKGYDRSDMIH